MNTVEPIRDINLVYDIADYLESKNERDYVMFMFGIYSGLRISDILRLTVRDVRDRMGKIKDHIYIREKKTGNEKRFIIHSDLQNILSKYVYKKMDHEYLFKSRVGYNRPIVREQAYLILRYAAIRFGIENIGTHTLRKTFGYHAYFATKGDIVAIQKVLGHRHASDTERYIGLDQERKDSIVKSLNFKRRKSL